VVVGWSLLIISCFHLWSFWFLGIFFVVFFFFLLCRSLDFLFFLNSFFFFFFVFFCFFIFFVFFLFWFGFGRWHVRLNVCLAIRGCFFALVVLFGAWGCE